MFVCCAFSEGRNIGYREHSLEVFEWTYFVLVHIVDRTLNTHQFPSIEQSSYEKERGYLYHPVHRDRSLVCCLNQPTVCMYHCMDHLAVEASYYASSRPGWRLIRNVSPHSECDN